MGDFFNCKVEDVADGLLDIYNNYEKHLKNSENARKWAEQYTTTSLRSKYLTLVKPKKVVLGESNVVFSEYLQTNSVELYEKYKRLVH